MTNLLTQHLDTWTTAPNGIKKLRELILELAVRGLLVPQNPDDEPASVLLENVKQYEAPFALPKSWTWVKLGDIGSTNIGLTYSPNDVSNVGIPVLRSSNVQNGKIDLSDLVRVEKEIKDSLLVEIGDLLICARNGSKSLVGKTAMIKNLSEKTTFGAFMAIYRSEYNAYIELFLKSPIFRRLLEGVSTTTINQITQNNLKNTFVSIPPLAEQHRIVAKVDELMQLCDQLEQKQTSNQEIHAQLVSTLLTTLTQATDPQAFQAAWTRIAANFDSLFTTESSIEQLKQTILQLAVMGKLVEQEAGDEPASVLLEKIAQEKARLISEGKIKKSAPLPKISDDEKPFDLPDGWEWVRLGSVSELINGDRGKNYPNRDEYVSKNEGIPFINTGHIEPNGDLNDLSMNFITQEKFDSLNNGKIQKGDLLYCLRGATMGKTAFVNQYEKGAIASSLVIIRLDGLLTEKYAYKFLISPYGKKLIKQYDNGSAQPNLSANSVTLYVSPLPPLAEQHRIVAKVDELMALCDQLKTKLNTAKTLQTQLTEALVQRVV
jgi:type I restriction enzyme S subunit